MLLRRGPGDPSKRRHGVDGLAHGLTPSAVLSSLPRDRLELGDRGVPGGVRLGDLDVRLGDALEHGVEVRHGEAVEADVPDPGAQVAPDVELVPVVSALAQCLFAGEPQVEPLGDGHVLRERLASAELALGLVVVGDRFLGRAHAFEQVADTGATVLVVLVGDVQQGANLVEVSLRIGLRVVSGAAEESAVAVLGRGQFLPDRPHAVGALLELGAGTAQRLTGLVAAVAAFRRCAFRGHSMPFGVDLVGVVEQAEPLQVLAQLGG